jgi:hypothetical protein
VAHLPVGGAQPPQQLPAGVTVLDAGGGDHDQQQQPDGVHRDVPLAAVDLLASVKAAAGAGHGVGGTDRLGVEDRRAGLRVAAGAGAHRCTQGVVDTVEGAIGGPPGEDPVHRAPWWEVARQRSPHAAVVDQVADGIHDLPAGVRLGMPTVGVALAGGGSSCSISAHSLSVVSDG